MNPDILVHPDTIMTPDARGGDALLIVEVADAGLRHGLNAGAPNLRCRWRSEYGVITAAVLTTKVHRQPPARPGASRKKSRQGRRRPYWGCRHSPRLLVRCSPADFRQSPLTHCGNIDSVFSCASRRRRVTRLNLNNSAWAGRR